MAHLRDHLTTTTSVQINGGGRVPLSKAKCCRLCLPDEENTPKALPAGENVTALISVGCHSSTAKSKVSCESEPTTTFATGFQKAILVPSLASATFYPEGPMTCCVPALMLSNGTSLSLRLFFVPAVLTCCLYPCFDAMWKRYHLQ